MKDPSVYYIDRSGFSYKSLIKTSQLYISIKQHTKSPIWGRKVRAGPREINMRGGCVRAQAWKPPWARQAAVCLRPTRLLHLHSHRLFWTTFRRWLLPENHDSLGVSILCFVCAQTMVHVDLPFARCRFWSPRNLE